MELAQPKAIIALFLLAVAIGLLSTWILLGKLEIPVSGLVPTPPGTVSASVQATVDIFLKNATVNFGAVQVGASYDTSVNYSNASQFLLRNDGSVKVNVTITTTWLWTSVCVASHFRFNVTNASGNTSVPSNCNNYNQSTWYNIPNSDDLECSPLIFPSGAVCNLNFSDGNDYARIDIQVTVPTGESAGSKTATVTFTASQA